MPEDISEAQQVQRAMDAMHLLESEAEMLDDQAEAEPLWSAARWLRQRYGLGLDDIEH